MKARDGRKGTECKISLCFFFFSYEYTTCPLRNDSGNALVRLCSRVYVGFVLLRIINKWQESLEI